MAKKGVFDKPAALADWKGNVCRTVRDVADKYKISVATAHKLVKGEEKTVAVLVNKQCELNQEVALLNEHELNAFTSEVVERSKHIQFFTSATLRNISVMMSKIKPETVNTETKQVIDPGSTISDHRVAQAAIKDGRDTVLGKTPDTAIQINNTNNSAPQPIQTTDPQEALAAYTAMMKA